MSVLQPRYRPLGLLPELRLSCAGARGPAAAAAPRGRCASMWSLCLAPARVVSVLPQLRQRPTGRRRRYLRTPEGPRLSGGMCRHAPHSRGLSSHPGDPAGAVAPPVVRPRQPVGSPPDGVPKDTPAPPAPSPPPDQPPTPEPPRSGSVIWSGLLQRGGIVIISGDRASGLSGKLLTAGLPGVPVVVTSETSGILICEPPTGQTAGGMWSSKVRSRDGAKSFCTGKRFRPARHRPSERRLYGIRPCMRAPATR